MEAYPKHLLSVKVINAFNAGDTYDRFNRLIGDELKDNTKLVYERLSSDFDKDMWDFLKRTATERQAELLKANGSIWSALNMFNVLNALKEQKPLDPSFEWIKEYL